MQDVTIGWNLVIGAGLAVAIGLAAGGAVKPTPSELQQAGGMGMEAVAHDGETVAQADPGWARYGSHLPSWVLGTDALKAAQAWAAPPEAEPEPATTRQETSSDEVEATAARYDEPVRPETSYHSQGGGILADREARQAPPHMDDLPSPDATPD